MDLTVHILDTHLNDEELALLLGENKNSYRIVNNQIWFKDSEQIEFAEERLRKRGVMYRSGMVEMTDESFSSTSSRVTPETDFIGTCKSWSPKVEYQYNGESGRILSAA